MTLVNEQERYPAECAKTGADCSACIATTARCIKAVTQNVTAEAAMRMFRRMYSHPACLQMEHQFVWGCVGLETPFVPAPQQFVTIEAA